MTVRSPMPYIVAFLNRICLGMQQQEAEEKPRPDTRPAALQQKELEQLCGELFRKKSLVTSGKLQLIGLEKVRRRLGARWPALQAEVYAVAEDVMSHHLSRGDIHLRHKEDTYLILFAHASREEGEFTASVISHEISKRLFASPHQELRALAVKKHIVQASTAGFAGKPLAAMLDEIAFTPEDLLKEAGVAQGEQEGEEQAAGAAPAFSFLPLWDVKLGAITTWLCRMADAPADAQTDMVVLARVIQELDRLDREQRPALVMCPVHYATLGNPATLARYETLCRNIPEHQRRSLLFKLEDLPDSVLKVGGTRFFFGLRKYARGVFAEGALGSSMDMPGLRHAGFDAFGVCADGGDAAEQAVLSKLKSFGGGGGAPKNMKKFLLGVPSLSIATAAVCMGFDYIAGPAIADALEEAEGISPFTRRDLAERAQKMALSGTTEIVTAGKSDNLITASDAAAGQL